MKLRELVDMKKTFEGFSKLKLLVIGINVDYNDFKDYFYVTYKCNNRFNMDFHIREYDAKTIDCIYCWYKPVNKNSIKYDNLDSSYSLLSSRTDAILNIIGDVDIDKYSEYGVFWDDKSKDLYCIVNYASMSSDKQKIIDGLVNKYYTRMVEVFNERNSGFSGLGGLGWLL